MEAESPGFIDIRAQRIFPGDRECAGRRRLRGRAGIIGARARAAGPNPAYACLRRLKVLLIKNAYIKTCASGSGAMHLAEPSKDGLWNPGLIIPIFLTNCSAGTARGFP